MLSGDKCFQCLHFPTGVGGRGAYSFCTSLFKPFFRNQVYVTHEAPAIRPFSSYSNHMFSSYNNPQCQREVGKSCLPCAQYKTPATPSRGSHLMTSYWIRSSWDGWRSPQETNESISAFSSIDVLLNTTCKLNLFFKNNGPTTFRHNQLVTKDGTVFTNIEVTMSCSSEEPDGIKQLKNQSWSSSYSYYEVHSVHLIH